MTPKVERISEIPNVEIAEGPHWDPHTESFYFVSITENTIYKYVAATKKVSSVVFENPVSFIIPVKDTKDKFVITLQHQLAVITWDGESDKVSGIQIIGEVDKGIEQSKNRINDGKCDPSGRLWFGTMGEVLKTDQFTPERGTFYSLEKNVIKEHANKIGISNGLSWNMALQKMYYIDSLVRTVDQFDFDITTGTVANRTPIFTLDKHHIDALPDGMTIDVDGNLWVACYNAHRVIKIDPRRPETLLETIDIPAKKVTSVAFGGPNLDVLFVTSASSTTVGAVFTPPEFGGVFKVTGLNTKGLPASEFVL